MASFPQQCHPSPVALYPQQQCPSAFKTAAEPHIVAVYPQPWHCPPGGVSGPPAVALYPDEWRCTPSSVTVPPRVTLCFRAMADRPPIIRIRCEGSEDECCSSGGEEVAAQWGAARPAAPDKRHSAPEIRINPGAVAAPLPSGAAAAAAVASNSSGGGGGGSQVQRSWLAPHASFMPSGARYSLPLMSRSASGDKRLSAPSCLAPPTHSAYYPTYSASPSSYYSSRRCSLDEGMTSVIEDAWHYRRLCRLHRRRFSDTARLDTPGKASAQGREPGSKVRRLGQVREGSRERPLGEQDATDDLVPRRSGKAVSAKWEC